ncbi:MAG: metallophosphoesterase [Sedimentisphaerales bacterium]|nr:metallophosphoesterase [Sedimentisphaerales bacterium]
MTKELTGKDSFQPFKFAHITDLHLREDDGFDRLQKFIQMLRKWEDVAFVLITGDFMCSGSASEVKAIFDSLPIPVHCIYGNNDWDRLDDLERNFGPLDKTFVHNNCLFVMLWNCVPHFAEQNHRGDWSEEQHDWLHQQFQWGVQNGCQHLFFCSHVPPFCPKGFFPLFFMREAAEKRLWRLCDHYGITAAFFGHLHQTDQFTHNKTEILITPSLNWNFIETEESRFERIEGGGAVRLVTVHADSISHQLVPVSLPGDRHFI